MRRISKAQLTALQAIRAGKPFCEFFSPDSRVRFYRSLGEFVPARLTPTRSSGARSNQGSRLRRGSGIPARVKGCPRKHPEHRRRDFLSSTRNPPSDGNV